MKVFYKKQSPNIIRYYRKYSSFDNDTFMYDVKSMISKEYSQNHRQEFEIFKRNIDIFEKHAPLKKKFVSFYDKGRCELSELY